MEYCLAALNTYTVDPHFMVVGVQRTIDVMTEWLHVTQELRLIMADASKREAGVASLWFGLRAFSALGIATIPEAKLARVVLELSRIGDLPDELVYFEDYRSLTGLLEHLRPWADNPIFLNGDRIRRGIIAGPRCVRDCLSQSIAAKGICICN